MNEDELKILKSMLYNSDYLYEGIRRLSEEEFSLRGRIIFNALKSFKDSPQELTLSSLVEYFSDKNIVNNLGLNIYTELEEVSFTTKKSFERHIKNLKRASTVNKLIEFSSKVNSLVGKNEESFNEVLKEIQSEFFTICEENNPAKVVRQSDLMKSIVEEIQEYERTKEKPKTGIKTGFTKIDKYMGGWRASEHYVVAARTSVGKSVFALQVALKAAEQANVGIISLEMSAKELGLRNLATRRIATLGQLRDFDFSDIDTNVLINSAKELERLPIFYVDCPQANSIEFRAHCRTLYQKFGCRIIIVDYLQRLKSEKQDMARWQEVAEISWMMKTISMELDIPIVALAQLNRKAEDYEEPELHHLRESGDLETNADTVLMLYRTQQSDEQYNNSIYPTMLKIAKQRNGACVATPLFLEGAYCRFTENEPQKQISSRMDSAK